MEKLKIAQIRAITPNPLGKMYEFQPDEEGANVDSIANLAIIELSVRKSEKALRHSIADGKHPWAIGEAEDAVDLENWVSGKGRWKTIPSEVRVTVHKQKRKR